MAHPEAGLPDDFQHREGGAAQTHMDHYHLTYYTTTTCCVRWCLMNKHSVWVSCVMFIIALWLTCGWSCVLTLLSLFR